ncbi:tRNA pseudouridine(55) synthase TruB [bacterium]|nr:tRNA pseudouridine(55) synthase TruB [bacterium]
MTASGFLLFDKPAGRTSHTALSGFRKAFPASRVGHTGTLDGFATGLLVVVVGSYSRLAPWFTGLDKAYEAEVLFGVGTDTLDPVGDVVASGPIPSIGDVEAALGAFRGPILQTPPEYSAIHVGGARASDLAMAGKDVELRPRPITISSLELLDFVGDRARLRVECSSGTYVRALARDIAAACGTCAHLSALRRLRVGPFGVEGALAPDAAPSAADLKPFTPDIAAGIGLGVRLLDSPAASAFANGAPWVLRDLAGEGCPEGDIAVFDGAGTFLGILGACSGKFSYKLVLPREGASA